MRLLSCLLLSMTALAPSPALAQTAPVKPEDVGMSSERLQRVDSLMARLQAQGRLAGAVTVVARRGRLVSSRAHGFADLETKRPMRTDDIFQIQSMTKPIATVMVLMLLEEGRFLLGDPVAKFLPEFADMKIAVGRPDAAGGHVLVPPKRAITILDLLTHRAGFTGLPARGSPAAALRAQAVKSLPPNGDFTLEAYVKHLASSPLDAEPGTEFRYGPSTIVLGRLIEVVTGQSLADALRDRIFVPLGMVDTSFVVPESQRDRVARPYARTPVHGLASCPPTPRTRASCRQAATCSRRRRTTCASARCCSTAACSTARAC